MRKGYKQRRGLVALLSAFVLVVLLSIPALAVDSSAVATTYKVYVDGTFYLQDDSVIADYLTYLQAYTVDSGTISVYSSTNTLIGTGYNTIRVSGTDGGYSFNVHTSITGQSGSNNLVIVSSDNVAYASAEFSAYQGRYLVFNHVLLDSDSDLLAFLINCKASTSTLIISSAEYYANGIVDVIVGGFNGVITGLGSGVADFFQTLFLANDGTGNLSTFAIVSLVFIGIAVAFGIASWIIKKVGQ